MRRTIHWSLLVFVLLLVNGTACAEVVPLTIERENEDEVIDRKILDEGDVQHLDRNEAKSYAVDSRAGLSDRSFRQFEPHVDGIPRKAVVLDFSGGFSLWAQYSEGGHALVEWEIVADAYSVEHDDSRSEVTLHPIAPRTWQQFPTECGDCVDATGVSVSVRNTSDPDRIAFRVNDPAGVLPAPFPVFTTWTGFREDERMN